MVTKKQYYPSNHYSRTGDYAPGIISRIFMNKKTFKNERHNFENAYTLRLWLVSMCGAHGDYEYLEGVRHEDILL